MVRLRMSVFLGMVALICGTLLVFKPWQAPMRAAMLEQAHATALTPPENPMRVFHLGHSLVGRDMPAMLEQLAGPGHSHASQLGWGASLRDHWYPDTPVNGFEEENAHDHFRPARTAVGSGQYDAIILTEMVELRDAIRYHDSSTYKHVWADFARSASDNARVYLYETWHRLDDPKGWLDRLDEDYERLWRREILAGDIMASGQERATRVIPAGQVMAEFVRAVETQGGLGNVPDRTALFARNDDGTQDMIHLSDLGKYLVALTHYAVLYKRSPVGLPAQLNLADGSPAEAPTPEVARLMQEVVWTVVRRLPETGVSSS